MTFTQEQVSEIETLAGVGYSVQEIAMYLEVSEEELRGEYDTPGSEFRYRYDRGILMKKAERDKSLSDAAKNGSVTAVQELEKQIKDHRLENLKRDIINGSV